MNFKELSEYQQYICITLASDSLDPHDVHQYLLDHHPMMRSMLTIITADKIFYQIGDVHYNFSGNDLRRTLGDLATVCTVTTDDDEYEDY